jgi:hypothetical protein
MIELLRIHALVRAARVLIFIGNAADTVSRQSRAKRRNSRTQRRLGAMRETWRGGA